MSRGQAGGPLSSRWASGNSVAFLDSDSKTLPTMTGRVFGPPGPGASSVVLRGRIWVTSWNLIQGQFESKKPCCQPQAVAFPLAVLSMHEQRTLVGLQLGKLPIQVIAP